VSHSIPIPFRLGNFIVSYSKAKLKSNGAKASPCFRPFVVENISENVYLCGLQ
jgi:hypothetical protein